MKRKILLISPTSDNEALWITGNESPEVKNNIMPLGLATVAALTPEEFHVDIWDELVHGLIDEDTAFENNYDFVGITGYKNHLPRARQIAKIFRKRSIPVAVGGPGVSGTPEEYIDDFDIRFIGEAEKTWPRFLHDWEKGEHRSEYRQIEKVDLTDSPVPKWDRVASDVSKYALGAVQTTRGCPFDCEFCDVIYLFGRRPRHKLVQTVLEEVRTLQGLGVRSMIFSDDEFIGDRRYAKELLRELVPLNRSFPRPLSFATQLTLNVSKSPELLELLTDANFDMLFVGIETPNKESLKETHKLQNIVGDMAGEVHKILSYGLPVRAGIIVGFDHDDKDIFDIQYDFIQKACLPSVAINMLKAPAGTKLWTRLRQEGRTVRITPDQRGMMGHPRTYTNILPKHMSRVELIGGYRNLIERLYRWESFAERIKGFVSLVRRIPAALTTSARRRKLVEERIGSLNVGPKNAEIIQDIIAYTAQNAELLIERIGALIVQHAKYRETIQKLIPQLDRQIELELSGKLIFEVDGRPIPVPPAFKAAYNGIFSEIHQRLYGNIEDKQLVPQALVDVFTDFLVHCGKGFRELEEHHRSLLFDICDRTCAKFNRLPPEEFVAVINSDVQIRDIKPPQLADDVLKSIEQILIGGGKQ